MRHLTRLAMVVVALVDFTSPLGATSYLVTVGVDDATNNGNCTLREALFAATTNAPRDACAAGSAGSADLIQLVGSYSWTGGAFAITSGELVVRGATAPLTTLLDLDHISRFLNISGGAAVTIESLNVRDGNAFTDAANPRGGFIRATGASLTLRDTNVLSGHAYEGGVIHFESSGPSLLIERCRLEGNAAQSGGGRLRPRGGALYLLLTGAARARLVDTRIVDNRSASTVAGDEADGGGLYAAFAGDAILEAARVEFARNVVSAGSGGFSSGAGAVLVGSGTGTAHAALADTTWADNDLQGSPGSAGSALTFLSLGPGTQRLERARFSGNDVGELVPQLVLLVSGQSTLTASDVLVADGGDIGLRATAHQAATMRIGHATIVGADTGAVLQTSEMGVVRVENSLFWDNATDVVDTVPSSIDPSTMTGVDPLFVSPGTGDYRLGPGSPAAEFGNRLLSSVGPFDLAHAPRVVGAQTDAGAFERGGVFADGFESGDAGAWSAATP